MKKLIIISVLAILLSSCSSGTYKYTKPIPPKKIPNSCVVNKDIETVWKDTINYVGSTAYVIDNIARDSYIITLSFTEDKTDQYINCGSCEFSVKGLRIEKSFKFNSNTPYTNYLMYEKSVKKIKHLERRMKLSGKINIILMKLGENKTRVKVNTTYSIVKSGEIFYLNDLYPEDKFYVTPYTLKMFFTTTGKGTDTSDMICYPSFKLEKDILMGIVKKL